MKAGIMPEEHTFFQRYQSPDPVALAQKIERDSAALVVAKDEQARLELISRIGSNYTNLWQEERAVPILERALALAQQVGNSRIEIVNLISLATAQQYCGNRDLAETLFQEALQKMQEYNQPSYEDVALHHLGRWFCAKRRGTGLSSPPHSEPLMRSGPCSHSDKADDPSICASHFTSKVAFSDDSFVFL
jgi:tetratricopeptide (TPR) repeat protein